MGNRRHPIERLYERIPSLECEPGCAACCGPHPWAKWEWLRVPVKRKAHTNTCPYVLREGGCEAYEFRPLICRLYGTADDPRLKCPKGRRPAVMLTQREAAEITMEYAKWVEGFK